MKAKLAYLVDDSPIFEEGPSWVFCTQKPSHVREDKIKQIVYFEVEN